MLDTSGFQCWIEVILGACLLPGIVYHSLVLPDFALLFEPSGYGGTGNLSRWLLGMAGFGVECFVDIWR
jgi:hypothetical protein